MLQLTMVYDFKTLMSPKCVPAMGGGGPQPGI